MNETCPLKVLQIVDTLGVGGAETWLMELLRRWSRTGEVEMDFLATGGKSGIFDEEAEQLGAQIHYVRYGRAHLVQFIKEFRQLLRNGRYDAIHDNADYASGWHFLMSVGVTPNVRVSHVHNPWLHIASNYAISTSRRLTTVLGKQLVQRRASHVCGTSEEILKRYGFVSGHFTRPAVSVVHCGFNIAKFNAPLHADRQSVLGEFNFPQDAKVVLFAGRLDQALEFDHPQNHKNSWFALNVLRRTTERNPSIRLLMAGAGDSRPELEARVRGWGLQDLLHLTGVRTDIPRLMRAADVLLFPSRQEGLGMVAVEAQAAGLPVLASAAVPQEAVVIPELFDAVSLHDPINLWADALLKRIDKPRPSLDYCRRVFESSDFSIGNSARRLEEIYRSGQR